MREYIDILWITFTNILLFLQKTKHKHNKYFFIPTYTLESLLDCKEIKPDSL